jgi:hypothetical protein
MTSLVESIRAAAEAGAAAGAAFRAFGERFGFFRPTGHYIIAFLDEEDDNVVWYDALPIGKPIPDGWLVVGSDGIPARGDASGKITYVVPWTEMDYGTVLLPLPAAAGPLYQPKLMQELHDGMPVSLTTLDFASAFAVLTAGDKINWEA